MASPYCRVARTPTPCHLPPAWRRPGKASEALSGGRSCGSRQPIAVGSAYEHLGECVLRTLRRRYCAARHAYRGLSGRTLECARVASTARRSTRVAHSPGGMGAASPMTNDSAAGRVLERRRACVARARRLPRWWRHAGGTATALRHVADARPHPPGPTSDAPAASRLRGLDASEGAPHP